MHEVIRSTSRHSRSHSHRSCSTSHSGILVAESMTPPRFSTAEKSKKTMPAERQERSRSYSGSCLKTSSRSNPPITESVTPPQWSTAEKGKELTVESVSETSEDEETVARPSSMPGSIEAESSVFRDVAVSTLSTP